MNTINSKLVALFTVSQIARAMGCTRQNVHQQLAPLAPDGEQLQAGQRAKAWRIGSLPPAILQVLAARAQLKRYPSVAFLLAQPFSRYESEVPFAEVAVQGRDKALKLQRALRPLIESRNGQEACSIDFVNRGISEYGRIFGYSITGKHWRALFDRTIERDNGNEEWHRAEIYLDEKPDRISANRPVAIARERGLEVLEDAMASLAGIAAISVQQKTHLWMKVCDELQLQLVNGAREKRTKRAILKTLVSSGLLGADPENIRRNFNRQWSAYCANACKLVDRRTTRVQHVSLPEEDRRKLIAGVVDCGGRISQGVRELRASGELSAQTADRMIANPRCKSHVPARIRREIGPAVKTSLLLKRGDREFELKSAHNTRDYSSLFAGDSYQADDCTCPVYYWEPDYSTARGYRILRGQLILMIDERTLLALGFALHSERNYNARVIRALITRVHDAWGLPRRRFYFERGIWRNSKILTGQSAPAFHVPVEDTEIGLREFGIAFQHAKWPRGKVIERVLGIVQNEMERLAGYVGRNERDDRHDRVQKKINEANAGHLHPSQFLMKREEWLSALTTLIDKCNTERRDGRMLNGMSPLEAWNALQTNEGQVQLGDEGRVILAEHRLKMRVQRSGIKLRPSLGGGTYCGDATGKLRGRDVLVWVNPEDLSAIGITSLDRREGPFVVPRLDPLPAIGATNEQFARSAEQINAHNGHARTVYRLISPHLAAHKFRGLSFVDSRTSQIGSELNAQRLALTQHQDRGRKIVRTAQRKVADVGMNIRVSPKNAERTSAAAELLREVYSGEEPE